MLLFSQFSPQYGLFWAMCPFPIIKYIDTYTWRGAQDWAVHRAICCSCRFMQFKVTPLSLKTLLKGARSIAFA